MNVLQIILVLLWFSVYNFFTGFTGLSLTAGGVVLNGLATGLIMGDVTTGFYLGGTYELMNIGLNPLGGSTVPNYNMGVVVGVAFGSVYGLETGMAAGIVVATLASTLDVLGKMVGSFFLHKAQDEIKNHNIDKAVSWLHLGFWPRQLLQTVLPLLILFIAGEAVVAAINSYIPSWVLSGFKAAGNVLPAIGFAILLRSMSVKGNIQYLVIGYVLYAYLGVGALGSSLVGVCLALIDYKNSTRVTDLQNALGGVDDE